MEVVAPLAIFIVIIFVFFVLPIVIEFKSGWYFRIISIFYIVFSLYVIILNFDYYKCKSRQSEAKQSLGTISKNQEAYLSEFGTYADSSAKLGFAVRGETQRYTYGFCKVSSTQYTAIAVSDNHGRGVKWHAGDDIWIINQKLELRNIRDVCHGGEFKFSQVSDAERKCIKNLFIAIGGKYTSINKIFVSSSPFLLGIILIILYVAYDTYNKKRENKDVSEKEGTSVSSAEDESPDSDRTICPVCGGSDIVHGAYIEDGGFGDRCPHCRKSLREIRDEINNDLRGIEGETK